jgi:hypothetical protein
VLIDVAHAVAETADEPAPDARPCVQEPTPRRAAHLRVRVLKRPPAQAPPNRAFGSLYCTASRARARADPAGAGHPSHAAGGSASRRRGPKLGQRPPFVTLIGWLC